MSWIAVGRSADVLDGMAMPARVRDTDLAIWRSASGHIHAWGDRCPHRGMRLSHGFVRGETLACIYHGWQYNDAGACVGIPAHPQLDPPKSICATTYACKENNGLIWVALDKTNDPLPSYDGLTAIRSLDVALPASKIAVPEDITVVLQPVSDTSTMLHIMAAADANPHDISDQAEALRANLEGVPA